MIRSGNPALNAGVFQRVEQASDGRAMTLQGTVNKSFIMLFLLIMTASYVWGKFMGQAQAPMFGNEAGPNPMSTVGPLMMTGLIGGLIFGLITAFKRTWAPVTAPIYALLEGLLIGGISAIFEARFPGIVIQAVGLTFGTLFCLLLAYKSGLIKVTENFKLGVVAATGGIFLLYMVNFVMSFFGASIGFIHSSGTFGIIFSLFVVGVAALNLVMDFDFIESASEATARGSSVAPLPAPV